MTARSIIGSGLCTLVLLASLAGVGFAQRPATQPANALAPVPRVPEYAATARISERMLNEQAGQMIVLPSEPRDICDEPERISAGALAKLTPEPKPLPEGYVIAGRPARIERAESEYILHVEPVPRLPDIPPLRILPNTRLTMLEAALAEARQEHKFLVTGRITEFQGANYILLENLALMARQEETPVPPAPTPPAPTPAVMPETRPGGEAETRPTGREPTAEELIQQLMQDRPPRSVAVPDEAGRTDTAPARPVEQPLPEPPDAESAHWREDTLLSDRPARLLSDQGGGWMLAFEDRGKRPQDQPVLVLPGRLLETAINLTAGGTRSVVLVVSGEVTAHKGINHVLLRKVLVRRNMGNLR